MYNYDSTSIRIRFDIDSVNVYVNDNVNVFVDVFVNVNENEFVSTNIKMYIRHR